MKGMLETTSEPLLLVPGFGEVDWSLFRSWVGMLWLVRENAFGLAVTPAPHSLSRGNGTFSLLGAENVCLGTILYCPTSTEIPSSSSAVA